MWLAIAVEPDELHIVPQNDFIEHTTSEECICGPSVDYFPDRYMDEDFKLIIHVSLDGRELSQNVVKLD